MIRVMETILTSDIEADPRYSEVCEILPYSNKYYAKKLLEQLIKMEREGKTESMLSVKERNAQEEGLTLNELTDKYINALDVSGYKVYKKQAHTDKTHGYQPVRAGSSYVKTRYSKSKWLFFRAK